MSIKAFIAIKQIKDQKNIAKTIKTADSSQIQKNKKQLPNLGSIEQIKPKKSRQGGQITKNHVDG